MPKGSAGKSSMAPTPNQASLTAAFFTAGMMVSRRPERRVPMGMPMLEVVSTAKKTSMDWMYVVKLSPLLCAGAPKGRVKKKSWLSPVVRSQTRVRLARPCSVSPPSVTVASMRVNSTMLVSSAALLNTAPLRLPAMALSAVSTARAVTSAVVPLARTSVTVKARVADCPRSTSSTSLSGESSSRARPVAPGGMTAAPSRSPPPALPSRSFPAGSTFGPEQAASATTVKQSALTRIGRASISRSRKTGSGRLGGGVAHLLGGAHVDDAQPVEEPHHLVGGVDLEPPGGEVRAHRVLVVVVLEQLAPGEEVDGQGVARSVVDVEVAVTVAVAAPVDDGAVDRAHDPVPGQEHPLPGGGGEEVIEDREGSAPDEAHGPALAHPLEEARLHELTVEARLGCLLEVGDAVIDPLGPVHH